MATSSTDGSEPSAPSRTGLGGQRAPADLVCSAKACRRAATYALLWNNPTLHTPERLKVWLACDEHRTSLGSYLDIRGFLRDTIPVAELTDAHG